MLSKNPSLSPGQIGQIMKATAVDIGPPGFDRRAGAGRLDALAAIAGVPCVDIAALPAEASCGGEKAPKPAVAAYRSARKLALSATGAPEKKARKKLLAARKRLLKGRKALDKQVTKGKVSAGCADGLRGAMSVLDQAASCRLSG
jgi:hypothetical protein